MTEEEFYGRPTGAGGAMGAGYNSLANNASLKDTNPKDAVGIRKAGMSCIPAEVLLELGVAMQEGAIKYGRHNYRVAGVRASVYYDAAMRHLMAWWEGEDIDPDSGLSHLVKAMACMLVIRDAVFNDNWVDDRPPSLSTGWQLPLNMRVGQLLDRYPTPAAAFTQIEKAPPVTAELGEWNYGVTTNAKGKGSKINDLGIGTYEVEITSSGTTWKVDQPEVWERYLVWMQDQKLEEQENDLPSSQTTLDLPLPSPRNHSHTSSDQGCNEPLLPSSSLEDTLQALTSSAGRPPVV
jgi:hypothetical protein